MILLIGFNVPSRLNRLIDRTAVPDYLTTETSRDARGTVPSPLEQPGR